MHFILNVMTWIDVFIIITYYVELYEFVCVRAQLMTNRPGLRVAKIVVKTWMWWNGKKKCVSHFKRCGIGTESTIDHK